MGENRQHHKRTVQKKLKERLVTPHVPSARLSGFENHYKIKLRSSDYRLVYEVIDNEICIMVISVGKRDKDTVYNNARERSGKR